MHDDDGRVKDLFVFTINLAFFKKGTCQSCRHPPPAHDPRGRRRDKGQDTTLITESMSTQVNPKWTLAHKVKAPKTHLTATNSRHP
jgi:hypothetical protein